MKKIISIICVLAMMLTTGCTLNNAVVSDVTGDSQSETEGGGISYYQTVTTIEAGEASIAYREQMFAANGANTKTDEEIKNRFENAYLPYLNSRTEQKFPTVETSHELVKNTFDYGDVYSLGKDGYEYSIMYIHGGAWVWEIDALHVTFCDKLVDELNAKVYMPIYPLAPQSSYLEGYAMLEKVYEEILKDGKPVIVMGDSAGGNLTLGLVLKLKDEGKTLPFKVIALSPCADATFSNPEIAEYQKKDGYLSTYDCAQCIKMWANGADLTIPELSPINGDFANFPDTLIFVAECDILCPDVLKLYDKMCEAQINVSMVKGMGFWHVYPIFATEEQPAFMTLIKGFCE